MEWYQVAVSNIMYDFCIGMMDAKEAGEQLYEVLEEASLYI